MVYTVGWAALGHQGPGALGSRSPASWAQVWARYGRRRCYRCYRPVRSTALEVLQCTQDSVWGIISMIILYRPVEGRGMFRVIP